MAYGQHGSSAGGGLRKALSWVFYIVFVIGLVWLLQNFVVCPYTIPSGSMEDTIEVGDNVWSEKITYYTHEPQAGDIVTLKSRVARSSSALLPRAGKRSISSMAPCISTAWRKTSPIPKASPPSR